ncbi:MAG TPA: 50S ribosomal protein L10 [Solirubrobacteraceae bacterium]|jgi:large subunit ribosomal protein L10
MNRDQKAVAIAEIAAQIDESQAIFAVDYRGISVPQAAELRSKLREADATFKVVKNSLTERAADQAGAETLKDFLAGPTALTFVRGDVATAAKAIADYARATQLLPFKGGLMDGAALDPDQIRSISRLPSREALYGQLVGVVASPVSGLVRTLGALVGGLAVALGQVREKKESGEIPAAEAPAVEPTPEAAEETTAAASEPQESAAEEPVTAAAPEPDEAQAEEPAAEAVPEAEAAPQDQAEPAEQGESAQEDDNQADASADRSEIGQQPDDADANPTKED